MPDTPPAAARGPLGRLRAHPGSGRSREPAPSPTPVEAASLQELGLFDPDRDTTPDGGTSKYGRPGRPFKDNNPFIIGFLGALGVAVAVGLVMVLSQLTTVIVYLVVSIFLALGLEPLVEWLQRRGLKRGPSIAVVVVGVVAVVAGIFSLVVPIVTEQAGQLIGQLPGQINRVSRQDWFLDLDRQYDVVGTATDELQARLTNQAFLISLFGGIFGIVASLVGSVVGIGVVVVLTLYFLATLGSMRHTLYRLAPASRRRRVQLIGDEISRRIGGYITGQVLIATLNGLCSYVMMLIVGVPFPAVLALLVGFLGLLPLVGATLGAVVVAVVALFGSPGDALIVVIYYLVYQQLENYVLAPRVMQRTVSVPGAVTVVAALAGGTLFGVLGALVAIPTAAAVLLIMNEVLVPRQDRN